MTRDFANAGAARRVYDEAERWLVQLLDADPNDPRHAGFRQWLVADPAHARAYREVERLWRLSEAAAQDPELMAAANRALYGVSAGLFRQLQNWLAPAFAIAAALVILVGVAAYSWTALAGLRTDVRYVTRTGQQRTIPLRDGSALLLDTDSAVVVDYGYRARRVTLLRGRAEFRVRHDAAWPFIVDAGGGTVTDIGTTFQVGINQRGEVHVVLLEGKVSVATAHADTTLTSGEALLFGRAGIVHAAYQADLQAALGWTSDEIVAQDWSLSHLLAEMNRYSSTKLELGDAALREVRVTGTFRAGDQATLLKVLESGWPIRAHRLSSTEIVLLRK